MGEEKPKSTGVWATVKPFVNGGATANVHIETPLMLAAMHGNISCVKKLSEAGANILMFDSLNGRTCLHYAAYYGHSDCLQAILSAARTSHVAVSCLQEDILKVALGRNKPRRNKP